MNPAVRRIHFVVPAYDEWENVPFLLRSIAGLARFTQESIRVVIVDDGSTDGTGDLAADVARRTPEIDVDVVRHVVNQGPGAAFRTGLRHVLESAHDRDLVVTFEADNTSDVMLVPRMLDRVERGADLVLATVYGAGRIVGAPLSRRVLSWGANTLVKLRFGLYGLSTYSSFFRMVRVPLLREAFDRHGDELIQEQGFACMVELLVKFKRMGAHIEEVPMLLDSRIRRGASKMRVVRTVRTYMRLLRGIDGASAATTPTDSASRMLPSIRPTAPSRRAGSAAGAGAR